MAIKYYPIPEKRQIIAVMPNTKYDAYNKIDKIMRETGFCFNPCGANEYNRYLMPEAFKVVLNCDARDVYDEEKGKEIAKRKLMRNYRKCLNKRLAKFKSACGQLETLVNTKID